MTASRTVAEKKRRVSLTHAAAALQPSGHRISVNLAYPTCMGRGEQTASNCSSNITMPKQFPLMQKLEEFKGTCGAAAAPLHRPLPLQDQPAVPAGWRPALQSPTRLAAQISAAELAVAP